MSDQGDEPDAQAQIDANDDALANSPIIDDGHGDIDDDGESFDGRNPSQTNDFFYISRDNNTLFPKDG